MEIKLRKALASDCADMLKLVRELAIFERAPHEVTVTSVSYTHLTLPTILRV